MAKINVIEFLGIWEQLNNPGFKPVEFDGFKKQAGINSCVTGQRRITEADVMRSQMSENTGQLKTEDWL